MNRPSSAKARPTNAAARKSAKTTAGMLQLVESTPMKSAAATHGVEPADVMTRLLKLNNRLMVPFSIHLEKRYKISLSEFRMLMTIGRIGATAAHELTDLTGINAMGVSRAISALRRHGRVTVGTDPYNRRRKNIQLTAKGRALYEIMKPASNRVAQYLFASLRADEIMAFNHFIETLTAQLEATDDRGRSLFLQSTQLED